MKNKTLTKNMPNVKWNLLPPRRGPNPQGVTYGMIRKIRNNVLRVWQKFNNIFNQSHGLMLLIILALLILSLQA